MNAKEYFNNSMLALLFPNKGVLFFKYLYDLTNSQSHVGKYYLAHFIYYLSKGSVHP